MKELQDEAKKRTEQDVDEKDLSETWAADAQDELEEWIEEQGIQLRY